MSSKKYPMMLSDLDDIPPLKFANYELIFESELTDFSRDVALKELRETETVCKDAVWQLRKLLDAEEDLVTPLHNEHWLIKFLRPCKFYPESARNLIKRYYEFKEKHSNIYDGLLPSQLSSAFQEDMIKVVPKRDHRRRRILIIEAGKPWNTKRVTPQDLLKMCIMLVEAAIQEPDTQVNGAVIIFDLAGFSVSQARVITPTFIKIIATWIQESIPVRIKAFHIVHETFIIDVLYKMVKPFLKQKLRDRIHFHGKNYSTLHQHIPPEYLFTTHGGVIEPPNCANQAEMFDAYAKFLGIFDEEYRTISSYGYKRK
ncbi:clavesin-1-like [Phlebotomus argentipes]|uniref:clavesin-1-like n=1 Tax=Phlebotomus argentipes TaxID=94469 RepID=UPI00289329E2|nr:clavesin-1-like [Phlebotomus argentipes]